MTLPVLEAAGFGDADRWAARLNMTHELTGMVLDEADLAFDNTSEGDNMNPELFTDADREFLMTLGGTTMGQGIDPSVDLRFPGAA